MCVVCFCFYLICLCSKILFGKDLQKEKKEKKKRGGAPGNWPKPIPFPPRRPLSGPADQPSVRASPPFLLVSLISGPTCQPNHPLPPAMFEQETCFGRIDPETLGFPSQGGKPSPIKFFPRSGGLLLHPNRKNQTLGALFDLDGISPSKVLLAATASSIRASSALERCLGELGVSFSSARCFSFVP